MTTDPKMIKRRPPEEPEYASTDMHVLRLSRMKPHHARKLLTRDPNHYPRFLYKYVGVDKEQEHLRDILIDCDFYLNSPNDFNDPFDTSAKFVCEGPISKIRQRFMQIVKRRTSGLSRAEMEAQVTQMMVKRSESDEWLIRACVDNTKNSGVFSMTSRPRNILMWSHYGSKHQGMVLQFDISKDPQSLLYALKNHYSNDYPTWNYINDLDKEMFNAVMLRKSKKWKYEKEWRILRIGGAHTYQPFKPSSLTGIIFGCKSPNSFKYRIQKLLKEREAKYKQTIKVYQCIQSDAEYSVSIARYTNFMNENFKI